MFRGRTVMPKFWQFQKEMFFFNFECFWTKVKPEITFDNFYRFWSCCLVHSQKENFLNQSFQKLHYRPTATSIINTKLLHIFLIY